MNSMYAVLLVAFIGMIAFEFTPDVSGCLPGNSTGNSTGRRRRHIFQEVSECYSSLNLPHEVPDGHEQEYFIKICSNLDRLTDCVKDTTGGCLDNSGNPFRDAMSKLASYRCACRNIQDHLENYSCFKAAIKNSTCLDMTTMPITYTHTPYIPDSDWDKFCKWYKGSIDCQNMMIASGCPSIAAVATHQEVNMAGMHSICKQKLRIPEMCEDAVDDLDLLNSAGHIAVTVIPMVVMVAGAWVL